MKRKSGLPDLIGGGSLAAEIIILLFFLFTGKDNAQNENINKDSSIESETVNEYVVEMPADIEDEIETASKTEEFSVDVEDDIETTLDNGDEFSEERE